MRTKKTVIITQILAMVAGISKHFATTAQVTIAGANYTPAALTTALMALATLLTDVTTAEASYKAKLATADAQAGALLTLLAASEAFVRATVGSSPDPLHDFGLMPRKVPAPRTAAQKAAAAVKGRATRAARHTMGSVQKKSVTGAAPAATSTTVVPVTAATSATASAVAPGK